MPAPMPRPSSELLQRGPCGTKLLVLSANRIAQSLPVNPRLRNVHSCNRCRIFVLKLLEKQLVNRSPDLVYQSSAGRLQNRQFLLSVVLYPQLANFFVQFFVPPRHASTLKLAMV